MIKIFIVIFFILTMAYPLNFNSIGACWSPLIPDLSLALGQLASIFFHSAPFYGGRPVGVFRLARYRRRGRRAFFCFNGSFVSNSCSSLVEFRLSTRKEAATVLRRAYAPDAISTTRSMTSMVERPFLKRYWFSDRSPAYCMTA